jgi:hypothetical protein
MLTLLALALLAPPTVQAPPEQASPQEVEKAIAIVNRIRASARLKPVTLADRSLGLPRVRARRCLLQGRIRGHSRRGRVQHARGGGRRVQQERP